MTKVEHKPRIDALKSYSVQEILDEQFIPFLKSYSGIYSLVTEVIENTDKVSGRETKLVTTTTRYKIKSVGVNREKPWAQNRKIRVEGGELIKFLKLNKLIF